MWRRASVLAAMVLVLLPIGGASYPAEAHSAPALTDMLPSALTHAAWWIPEPSAVALLLLNATWLAIRCAAIRRRRREAA